MKEKIKQYRKRILRSSVLILLLLVVIGYDHNVFAEDNQEILPEEELDYIYGRKMTQEEVDMQKAMEPILEEMPAEDIEFEPVLRKNRTILPEYYDARNEGIVTCVKDQGQWGTCWCFAALAASETSTLKNNIFTEPDFSELHLSYFFYNRQNDPLGNTMYDQNVRPSGYLKSGNIKTAALALAGWQGAADEKIAVYSPWTTPPYPNIETAYQNVAVLRNARFLSKDIDEIKNAIMDFGAVAIMYNHDYTYMNYDTAAYCHPPIDKINHAVTIIGWDDNYSYKNFAPQSNVSENGAWIVKNSYGDDWEKEGYFYLSYEDGSVDTRCSFEFQPTSVYDNNYQYDGTASLATDTINDGGSLANVYEVKANPGGKEVLKAVEFMLHSPNVGYSIQIYINPEDETNPASGTPALSNPVCGYTENAGIYTVDLDSEIDLYPGDRYAIVITFHGKNQIQYYVERDQVNYSWVSFQAGIDPGQSFVHTNAGWIDLASNNECARIKGFTVNEELPKIKFKQERVEVELESQHALEIENLPGEDSGNIIWSTSDENIIEVNQGTVTAKNVGAVVVTAVIGTEKIACSVYVKPQPVITPKASAAGKNRVTLSWNRVNRAEGYLIYAMKSGVYGYVGMTTKGTVYTDTKALDKEYNFYWVFPYIKDLKGRMIVGNCPKYVWEKGICPAVTNLKASSQKGGVKLTWSASNSAEGYLVYGRVGGKDYGYVGMTTKGTTFTDGKASKDVYNYYWVFPYHKDQEGKMIVGKTAKYTYGRSR